MGTLRRTMILIVMLLFVPVNCAGTFGVTPLGGSPGILNLEITIGLSLEELSEKIGPPKEEEPCIVPISDEYDADAQGLVWEYGQAISITKVNLFELRVCALEGIIVSEQRRWWYSRGSFIGMGQSDFTDTELSRELFEGSLDMPPKEHLLEHDHKVDSIDI